MRVIDLFAGCGGLSLGFQNSGYDIVAAYDNWEPAVKIYELNFKHPIKNINLSNLENLAEFVDFNPDMIIGGPPCQDFSSAGKRNENNGRGDLTIDFARIVAGVMPEWFVMENVERIVNTQKLHESIQIFHSVGYGLTQSVLDASLCNVPQARKRFFLIGKLGEEDGFLDYYITKNLASEPMTVYDYLGDTLGIQYYYRHPRSYARRGVFSIHEPSPTIRGVNRPIPPNYTPHPGDATELSNNLRPLTTIERSYIQTFPADFKFVGSKTVLEQIIGNAVPVNLARYVADCISEFIATPIKVRPPKQLLLEF